MISLKTRSRAILEYLLLREGYVMPEEVAEHLHVSKRTIYYDLSEINDWLKSKKIAQIAVKRQKGLFLSQTDKNLVCQHLGRTTHMTYYTFSQNERIAVIICEILSSPHILHVEDFSTLCNVSRNTILNDLRAVKSKLARYKLELIFEPKRGYEVVGETIRKRAVFLYYLSEMAHLISRGIVGYLNHDLVKRNLERLTAIEEELGGEYVDGTLVQLAFLIAMIIWKGEQLKNPVFDREEIVSSRKFELVHKYFPDLPDEEQVYLAIHLLGARVQFPKTVNEERKQNYAVLSRIATRLIHEFEKIACIEFSEKDNLLQKLVIHLDSSFYRYRYGIVEGNPVGLEIERKYPELFVITQKVADSLTKAIGYPIPKSDIAYLALHFGAHLRTSSRRKCVIKILVVCQNGVATAQILRSEIEELVPFIEVVDIVSARELRHYGKPYDLIVSTVELDSQYGAIIVNPLLTVEDKQAVLARVFRMKKSSRQKDDAERIFDIMKQYVPEDKHPMVMRELTNYFSEKHSLFREVLEQSQPRLADLLTPELIQLTDTVSDWRKGISLAALPLLDEGAVDSTYVNAMIECVEKFGPYIFISPDVALAHAKPDGNVRRLSVSMLVAREGVAFPQDKIARVIIVLAPVDDEQHLRVLKDILHFFGNDSYKTSLLNSVNEVVAHSLIAGMADDGTDSIDTEE